MADILKQLMDWQKEVSDQVLAMNPRLANQIQFSGSVPIWMLPYESQVEQMRQYRKIIGLDDALNNLAGTGTREEKIANIFNNMNEVKKREFVRFKNLGDSDLDRIYKGLNLQFSERPRSTVSGLLDPMSSGLASSHFGPGMQSIAKMSERRLNMPSRMKGSSSFTTFDIETAGLMQRQIYDVSFHSGTTDAAGNVIHSSVSGDERVFRPRGFSRGSMGMADETGRVVPLGLEDFMQKSYDMQYRPIPKKAGEDFAEQMTPFLERLKSSDNIIGHNILHFDIPQIFTALAGTKKYGRNEAFRSLVDTTHAHVLENAIDTLVLARQSPNLAGIETAKELAKRGEGGTHSIENLLLQTDLAERMGYDKLKALMGEKGLHFGEVDDAITLALYEHMPHLKLKTLGQGHAAGHVSRQIRSQVIESAAITPTTNIRKAKNVADEALRKIISIEGGIKDSKGDLKKLLARAQAGDGAAAQEAFDLIRKGNQRGLRFNINPIEHQALTTRRLGMIPDISTAVSSDSLLFNNNIFDRAIYGNYNPERNHALGVLGQKPLSDLEMGKVQEDLQKAGLPWAGLSYEERSFGTTLSHLTKGVNPSPFRESISSLTSDLMVSHFETFHPGIVEYSVKSGARPSLPVSLLEDYGILKDNDGSILRMSTVDPTLFAQEPRINLVYDFQKGSNVGFADYLEQLGAGEDSGISRALGNLANEAGEFDDLTGVAKFREALTKGDLINQIRKNPEKGVSIGQLQPRETTGVYEFFRNFFGRTDRLADDEILGVGLPYLRRDGNFLATSAALLTKHLSEEEKASIPLHVGGVMSRMKGFEKLGSEAGYKLKIAQADAKYGGTTIAKNAYEAYQKIRPHIGAVAGGAALFAMGMHFYNKHQENKQFNAPFENQGYEDDNNYSLQSQLQARMDAGIDRSRQRYDPLSTAFVVNNLDNNKINHSLMGSEKDNSLYGGVL